MIMTDEQAIDNSKEFAARQIHRWRQFILEEADRLQAEHDARSAQLERAKANCGSAIEHAAELRLQAEEIAAVTRGLKVLHDLRRICEEFEGVARTGGTYALGRLPMLAPLAAARGRQAKVLEVGMSNYQDGLPARLTIDLHLGDEPIKMYATMKKSWQ